MRRTTFALVVTATLALSACGGSGGSTTAAPTTAAPTTAAPTTVPRTTTTEVAVTLPATTATPRAASIADAPAVLMADGGFTADQARCIVDALVASRGEAAALDLANDGRGLAALPAADRTAVVDSVTTCVPKDQYATLIASTLLTDLADAGITQEQASCLGTGLADVLAVDTLLGLGSGGFDFASIAPETQAKFITVFTTCLPPEMLGKLAKLA